MRDLVRGSCTGNIVLLTSILASPENAVDPYISPPPPPAVLYLSMTGGFADIARYLMLGSFVAIRDTISGLVSRYLLDFVIESAMNGIGREEGRRDSLF
jgi:hypothetical protein